MDYEFEEDAEPTWLVKQREDSSFAEKAYVKMRKVVYTKV